MWKIEDRTLIELALLRSLLRSGTRALISRKFKNGLRYLLYSKN